MTNHTDDLIRFVDRWRKVNIVVAGDFMLDRYIYGDAERLSPDAPVPVLAVRRSEYRPGGAANVCLDLRALRCQVTCLGATGRDEHGKVLRKALRAARCSVAGLVTETGRPTAVKTSFIGLAQHRHPQKMFRIDQEQTAPLSAVVQRELLKRASLLLQDADVLCLEDYAKGVLTAQLCQKLIAMARRRRIPVLVDPAAIDDYRKYRGATCITPNRTEAALATGQPAEAPPAMARKLLGDLKLEAVVVTLDRHGAFLQQRGKRGRILATRARSVYDVTGAGDMVLAVLAAAIANSADWPSAVKLANIAAGLEVERFGVVPIDLEQILIALLEQRHADLGKVRTIDQLLPELAAYRKQGKTIALTNGCFDILHAGHVGYLRQAAGEGNLLVVAVNSDRSIGRIKGRDRPVNRLADRLMVLSELESIDYLIVFEEDTPMKLIRAIGPNVLVKGGDYQRNEVVGGDWVTRHGGRVALVKLAKGRSTTNIIRRISTL